MGIVAHFNFESGRPHGIQAIVPWCTSKSTRQRRQNAALFAQPYLGVRPQGIAQKIHQHADPCGLA